MAAGEADDDEATHCGVALFDLVDVGNAVL